MMLKELCAVASPSGFEDSVREYIINNSPVKEYEIDSIGNLIFHKKGNGMRVMVCAHMDEVGLLITGITEDGFLRFDTLGGIETSVLNSKKVLIGKDRLPGIIGSKAIHLQGAEETKAPTKLKSLYIDIGAQNKEDAQKYVEIGDYAVFDGEFISFGDNLIKSKALDDRIGCAVMLDLMKKEYENDMYFCFSVQEEIGVRGSRVAVQKINPDISLVLEGTTCADVYRSEPHTQVTNLGKGAVMTFMDAAAISDKKYFDFILNLACEKGIPLQIKKTTAGGTDARSIQLNGEGVKTAVLAVPCRYIHSPISVCHKEDIESLYNLSYALLTNLERSGL